MKRLALGLACLSCLMASPAAAQDPPPAWMPPSVEDPGDLPSSDWGPPRPGGNDASTPPDPPTTSEIDRAPAIFGRAGGCGSLYLSCEATDGAACVAEFNACEEALRAGSRAVAVAEGRLDAEVAAFWEALSQPGRPDAGSGGSAGATVPDEGGQVGTEVTDTVFRSESGITVIVPDGLLDEGETLSVRPQDPADLPRIDAALEPLVVFDVRFDRTNAFAEPVRIEIPLPADVAETDILMCRGFLEDVGIWQAAGCSVDAGRGVAVISADHFSVYGLFRTTVGTAYARYVSAGDWEFRIIADTLVPLATVETVGAALQKAAGTYEAAGFAAPRYRVDVILKDDPPAGLTGPEEARYDSAWLFGYITLPIRPGQTDADLAMDAVHELFHAVQNTRTNRWRMANRLWFVEATADYAAGYLVYPGGAGLERLTASWIATPLHDPDQGLIYQGSHFIGYLQHRLDVPFRDLLWSVLDDARLSGIAADTVASPSGWVLGSVRTDLARLFSLEPLDAFVTQRLPEQDLVAIVVDFVAWALFASDAPDMARLNSRSGHLRTRINAWQVVSVFSPYGDGTAQQPLELVPDYAARIWALDIGREETAGARTVLIRTGADLPSDVELALHVIAAGARVDAPEPVQRIRGEQRFTPVVLPPGQDLFVIAVNGDARPVRLTLEAEVLRSEESTRTAVGGGWSIGLPDWMAERDPAGGVWQAGATDLKTFETLTVRRRTSTEDDTPAGMCAAQTALTDSGVSLGAPLGTGRAVTVAGQKGWLQVYRGTWRQPARASETYLFHGPDMLTVKAGEPGPDVDVIVTRLCVVGDAEALMLETVSSTEAQGAVWPKTVLMSLERSEGPDGFHLVETFEDGLPPGRFQQIRTFGSGNNRGAFNRNDPDRLGFAFGMGRHVTVQPGFVRIHNEDPANGGGLATGAIPVIPGHTLVVRSRHRLHPVEMACRVEPGGDGGRDFHACNTATWLPRTGLVSADLSDLVVALNHMDVCATCRVDSRPSLPEIAFYYPELRDHVFLSSPPGQNTNAGNPEEPRIAPVWSTWFRQELRWTPETGEVVALIEGRPEIRLTVAPRGGLDAVRVFFHAYGSVTGHAHDLDDLEIFWVPNAEVIEPPGTPGDDDQPGDVVLPPSDDDVLPPPGDGPGTTVSDPPEDTDALPEPGAGPHAISGELHLVPGSRPEGAVFAGSYAGRLTADPVEILDATSYIYTGGPSRDMMLRIDLSEATLATCGRQEDLIYGQVEICTDVGTVRIEIGEEGTSPVVLATVPYDWVRFPDGDHISLMPHTQDMARVDQAWLYRPGDRLDVGFRLDLGPKEGP